MTLDAEVRYPAALLDMAERVSQAARTRAVKLVTAESCTGGLVSAVLTELAGASDVLDRGFVTYSNTAKQTVLGVPAHMIADRGAVSEAVARAMAEGALAASSAQLAVSITGVAGPGGGTLQKPVGLVHFACASRTRPTFNHVERYGDRGRGAIRLAAATTALDLLLQSLG